MEGGRRYIERLRRKKVLPLRKRVSERMVVCGCVAWGVRLDLGVM